MVESVLAAIATTVELVCLDAFFRSVIHPDAVVKMRDDVSASTLALCDTFARRLVNRCGVQHTSMDKLLSIMVLPKHLFRPIHMVPHELRHHLVHFIPRYAEEATHCVRVCARVCVGPCFLIKENAVFA